MKNLVLIIMVIFCTVMTYGQTEIVPKTPFTKTYLAVWLAASEHSLQNVMCKEWK